MDSRSLMMILDADGVVYNDAYLDLTTEIVKKYGKEIKKAYSERHLHQKTQSELIDNIKQFISTCERSLFSFAKDEELAQNIEFINYLDHLDLSVMDLVFMRATEALTQRIEERKLQYKRIILMSGSNRNNFIMDMRNAERNGTRLFCYDLKRYADRLGVELDPFLLGDVTGDLPPGESFSRILKHSEFPQGHAHVAWDENKILFILAVAHYIKLKYGDIDVEFSDDVSSIISSIHQVFRPGKADALLPAELSIDLVLYNAVFQGFEKKFKIYGTGRCEPQYAHYVKELINRSLVASDTSIDPAHTVDFVEFTRYYQSQALVSHPPKPFMSSQPLVLLVDADSHTYNAAYRILLFHMMTHHGDAIKKIHDDVNRDSLELNTLTSNVKKMIAETDIHSFSARENYFSFVVAKREGDMSTDACFNQVHSKFSILISQLDALDPSIMDLVFMRAAEALTAYINGRKLYYQDIILMSASNRWCHSLDEYAAERNGTRLFCSDLDMYAKKLNLALDKHLLDDTVSDLQSGQSFARILAGKNERKNHARVTSDRSKAVLLMNAVHHIKLTYGDAHVELCDDMYHLLVGMQKCFDPQKAASLLPAGQSIGLVFYNDRTHHYDLLLKIKGTGRVEKNYAYYVNKLIALAPRVSENVVDVATNMDFDHFIKSVYQPSLSRRVANRFLELYTPGEESKPLLESSEDDSHRCRCVVM